MLKKWFMMSIVIFFSLSLFSSAANKNAAAPSRKSVEILSGRPPKDYRVHNIGALWNTVTNFGSYGDPNSLLPSMEWLGESGVHYLWDGGLWIGAIVENDTLVSRATYGSYEWMPSEGSSTEFAPYKSDLDSYVTFDDLFQLSGHTPLGIKVFQRALTWSAPDFDDFIAYEYEIINVGDKVLNDVFVGWKYDCDVGTGVDPTQPGIDDLVDYDGWHSLDYSDWHGVAPNLITASGEYIDIVENIDRNGNGELDGYDECGVPFGDPYSPRYDPLKIHPDGYPDEWQVFIKADGDTLLIPRCVSYMYDADDSTTEGDDTGEIGSSPDASGYIGGRLLYAPLPAYHQTADDTIARIYAHQWWNWETGPGKDADEYLYLAGEHPAAAGSRFMRNPIDIGESTYDYRFFNSAGPFRDFTPGDTLRIVYVATVGQGLRGLREAMDHAMVAYYSGSLTSDPGHPSDPLSDYHWEIAGPPIAKNIKATPVYARPGQDAVKISARVYDIDGTVEMVQANIHLEDGALAETMPLVDDGTLGDGVAGDGVYTNTWSVPSTDEAFYYVSIYTSDSDGNEITREKVARFTSVGPIRFKNVLLTRGNTTPSPDEEIYFQIELENQGLQASADYLTIKVFCTDEFISESLLPVASYNESIQAGESGVHQNELMIRTSSDCPDGYEFHFDLEIASKDFVYWRDSFTITIVDDTAPTLCNIAGERHIPPGEQVTISVELRDGAGVKEVRADIQCPDDSTIATLHLSNTYGDVFEARWMTPADVSADYDIDLYCADNLDNSANYENLMGVTTKSFSVQNSVLLVDNDNYNYPSHSPYKKPFEWYYKEALDSCGIGCDVYSAYFYGLPDSILLASYSDGLVIWETGDTQNGLTDWRAKSALEAEEETVLTYFLDHGGSLLLSGQGLGTAFQAYPSFFRDYLGVSILNTDIDQFNLIVPSAADDPISGNLRPRLKGGTGANNQFAATSMNPIGDKAVPIFKYSNQEPAAVRVEADSFRVVFLGFGFEAISSDDLRIEMMTRIEDWLLQTAVYPAATFQTIPKRFATYPNFPNPFNPITTIKYDLPRAQHVKIRILNLLGQRVATLVNKQQEAGSYEIQWDATCLSSGIYIIVFATDEFKSHQKALLLK
ncbi:T9SS type A sorting domain-containing protein [candidate division KSB1 bacterium]|nr:T9SS type A sorting domain-containing protein [candidate division KSB1 bacterium]